MLTKNEGQGTHTQSVSPGNGKLTVNITASSKEKEEPYYSMSDAYSTCAALSYCSSSPPSERRRRRRLPHHYALYLDPQRGSGTASRAVNSGPNLPSPSSSSDDDGPSICGSGSSGASPSSSSSSSSVPLPPLHLTAIDEIVDEAARLRWSPSDGPRSSSPSRTSLPACRKKGGAMTSSRI